MLCFITIFCITKLHLPLPLRFAVLPHLAPCATMYPPTYVVTGMNTDNVAESKRFYDNGQVYDWLVGGTLPFVEAGLLF